MSSNFSPTGGGNGGNTGAGDDIHISSGRPLDGRDFMDGEAEKRTRPTSGSQKTPGAQQSPYARPGQYGAQTQPGQHISSGRPPGQRDYLAQSLGQQPGAVAPRANATPSAIPGQRAIDGTAGAAHLQRASSGPVSATGPQNPPPSAQRDGGPKPKRTRGQRRRSPWRVFVRTLVYAVLIVGTSLVAALFLIQIGDDALGLMKSPGEVSVVITEEMTIDDIAKLLKEEGVISYEFAFKLFADFTNAREDFQKGTFKLDKEMGYFEVSSTFKRKNIQRETIRVTIPEGKELREIVDILVEKNVCQRTTFEAALKAEYDYDFLKDLPKRDNMLEGYLFPDTYEFYVDNDPENPIDPKSVVKKMLSNFATRVSTEYFVRAEEMDMTMDEVITLASIVQKEAANNAEMPKVASVFHNRLDSSRYPRLQSCATVQYILQERKKVITLADTEINSPYNTYQIDGLPIGPIAAPGLDAIYAVLYPDETDYYFFVVDKDGNHIFSETYNQHMEAVANAGSSQGTGTVLED